MPVQSRFTRHYLILALLMGIFGLVDTALSIFSLKSAGYLFFLFILTSLYFLFNILTIAIFHHHATQRLLYILPIYNLSAIVIFGLGGIIITLLSLDQSIVYWILIGIAAAGSVFEILCSLYLLRRFDFR